MYLHHQIISAIKDNKILHINHHPRHFLDQDNLKFKDYQFNNLKLFIHNHLNNQFIIQHNKALYNHNKV